MVTVVTAVIKDRHDRILIQRRNKLAAFGGLWETPGGKVEPDKDASLVGALHRELKEELGLISVELDSLPFLMTRFYPPIFPSEGVVYLMWGRTEETPIPLEGQGEVIWTDIRQMDPDEMVPSMKVLRAYLRTTNGR